MERPAELPATTQATEQLCINTIRTLSMDAVQQANSGHPGTAMAMAPVMYELWQKHLRFDPEDPIWPNRDRFILSIGHASMLLYSLLHLTEVKSVNAKYEQVGTPSVSLDDIKRFRQLDSKCPGHPEYRWTSGVESTTGPLGQGVATSVGMAIAGQWMAEQFNKPDYTMFDYNVYALCGDGCMQEGISGEAASLAGHLKLPNLCWIYDNNHISIEGNTSLSFSEDVGTRFQGYGWNVVRVSDANNLERLDAALTTFKATQDRPTLIIVDSHIAYGSPNKQDTSAAHGEPLGDEEIRLTKKNYGWPEDAKFLVPDEVRAEFKAGIGARGKQLRDGWMAKFDQYSAAYPELADELYKMQHRELPTDWNKDLPTFPADPERRGGTRQFQQSPERAGKKRALADWRLRRPCPVHQNPPDIRRRGRLFRYRTERAQHALRHPRTRDGRNFERHVAVQSPSVWLRLFDFQRLRPPRHSSERPHGTADHPHLHARFDWRGRGRPDPSAD